MALHARLLLLWAMTACSSDDPTIKEMHAFVDDAGRACEATLERSSERAPVIASTIACDGAGRECPSGSEPCFLLSVLPESADLLNCPACCLGSSSRFAYEDCSAVTCENDADCVYDRAVCELGSCTCPSGRCE